MSVPCDHCASPVPVNGPTRSVHCGACQRDTPLSRVPAELALASEGMQQLGSSYSVKGSRSAVPRCRSCDGVVPLPEPVGQVTGAGLIPCPGCGTGLPHFPAPDWLRAELPTILHVFGVDPEIANAEGGLAIEIDQTSARPIVMACPACGGGLTITDSTDRTVDCEYCSSSVFVPDELWQRLHPVKTMRMWTVTYAGTKLVTAEEQAEQAQRRAEAEVAREQRLRRQEERAREAAAAARRRRVFTIVCLCLIGVAALGVTFVMLLS